MPPESFVVPVAMRPFLTTEELALSLSMNAQSIRKRYSQTGSYFGVKPVKLPNGKLRWPVDSIAQLIRVAA